MQKSSFMAAPPMPGAPPPMDPAMMAQQQGMPPMDPSMMQPGAPPMDPAAMQQGMPPAGPPMAPPSGVPMELFEEVITKMEEIARKVQEQDQAIAELKNDREELLSVVETLHNQIAGAMMPQQ